MRRGRTRPGAPWFPFLPAFLGALGLLGWGGRPAGMGPPPDAGSAPERMARVSVEIPPGYRLQDDMILPEAAVSPEGTYRPSTWPGGIVPYEFDPNVTAQEQQAAVESMAEWEARANVDFRPRNGEPDYIHFMDSFQNAAPVGYGPGQQTVHIYNWNSPLVPAPNSHVIVHELGHVLGFFHEHRRPDRDASVQILWDQIAAGREGDFQTVSSPAEAYGPYDFDSLMHGPQCHETHCPYCPLSDPVAMDTCRTILVLPPNDTEWQYAIGQRNHISAADSLVMHFLYPESDWVFVDGSDPGSSDLGNFLEPYLLFATGVMAVPDGGTVWVQPGTYSAVGTYTKAMTLRGPLGGVTLGN